MNLDPSKVRETFIERFTKIEILFLNLLSPTVRKNYSNNQEFFFANSWPLAQDLQQFGDH